MMSSSLTLGKLRAIKLAEDRVINYTLENKIEQSMFLVECVLEEDRDVGNRVKIGLNSLSKAPIQMDDLKVEVQDPLIEVNLGNEEEKKVMYISSHLTQEQFDEVLVVVKRFKDCFAWDYTKLPSLDRTLVEHRLPIKKEHIPHQQPPRKMVNEVILKVKEEIERLLQAGFIRPSSYVEWLSNIVSVLKKNGKLCVCIDFRNLNTATPKDKYPMPIIDVLVDGVARHKLLSFMNGHLGYNQIFIAEEDVHKIAFRCPGSIGTFEWVVMLFGLKNAGVTYHRAMNFIFHDMIGKFMEVYIDDVVVKSQDFNTYLKNLEKAFLRMRKHQLKMNPLKCAFGVQARNVLSFLVHIRGIEIDQNKAKAIT